VTLPALLLCLVLVAGVAAVAAGRLDGGLEAPTTTSAHRGLPEGPFAADAVDEVRFTRVLRGYRMDEVDGVLDRLREELRARDDALAEREEQARAWEAERRERDEQLRVRDEELKVRNDMLRGLGVGAGQDADDPAPREA
jgi:DivIVA domain-containing protein